MRNPCFTEWRWRKVCIQSSAICCLLNSMTKRLFSARGQTTVSINVSHASLNTIVATMTNNDNEKHVVWHLTCSVWHAEKPVILGPARASDRWNLRWFLPLVFGEKLLKIGKFTIFLKFSRTRLIFVPGNIFPMVSIFGIGWTFESEYSPALSSTFGTKGFISQISGFQIKYVHNNILIYWII